MSLTRFIHLQDMKSTFDACDKETTMILQRDYMKQVSREIEKVMKLEQRVADLEKELNEVETEFKKCLFE